MRNVFIRPLADAVWTFAFLSCILFMMLMKITFCFERVRNSFWIEHDRWSSIFIDMLAAVSQQGIHKCIMQKPNYIIKNVQKLSQDLNKLRFLQLIFGNTDVRTI